MPIRFTCTECTAAFEVADELAAVHQARRSGEQYTRAIS
jgi:hypothetical protein